MDREAHSKIIYENKIWKIHRLKNPNGELFLERCNFFSSEIMSGSMYRDGAKLDIFLTVCNKNVALQPRSIVRDIDLMICKQPILCVFITQ